MCMCCTSFIRLMCCLTLQELNGDVPDEEEAARLKEQMWPKKTSSIKTMFEAQGDSEEQQKEAPQQINLEAEISGMLYVYIFRLDALLYSRWIGIKPVLFCEVKPKRGNFYLSSIGFKPNKVKL